MYAYLTRLAGSQIGQTCRLDPRGDNLIGRGIECTIVVTDPVCSRTHAIISCRGEQWSIRDAGSRNKTYVNDEPIEEALLEDGSQIRMGSTEFTFHVSGQPPTVNAPLSEESLSGESIIRNVPLASLADDMAALILGASEGTEDWLLLYQLGIKLLGSARPPEAIGHCLNLLQEKTRAAVVAFLWLDDEGNLRPHQVLPPNARAVELSDSLTHLVCSEGRAVWVANQPAHGEAEEMVRYADVLCVPLLHDGQVIGAIHVYRNQGRFAQSDFEFTVSLANLAAVALVRVRKDTLRTSELARWRSEYPVEGQLTGQSPPMLDLKRKIERLGSSSKCVLIRGELGCGMTAVAASLHRHSPRADRPLVTVNCASLAAQGQENQLVKQMQQADLGTLFLSEIGELSLDGQALVMRLLDGHPLLSERSVEIEIDVRVLVSTSQDLSARVQAKTFQQDLYYRLTAFELEVPPLRDRQGDAGVLVDFYLEHFRYQHGRPELELSDAARKRLLEYAWPGNVRQLRNVLDNAVLLAEGPAIQPGDLPLGGSTVELDTLRVDHWERKLIVEALERTGGKVPEAAKLLGLGRATLYRKIDDYGIER